MNKKHLASLLIALPIVAHAQQIKTINKVIDCGQIIFKHPVTVEYEIQNTGILPLHISKVLTSCGCTTVEYPHKAIAPNHKAIVKVTYDAKQLGHFQKQIGVVSNATHSPFILTLKGKTVAEIVDFSGEYPFTIGELQTDVNNIEFDDVNLGDRPHIKIHIKNPTTNMAEPIMMHLPPYLKADLSPSRLAPGHEGIATITLDSKKIRNYGLTQTSIYMGFVPGDKVSPEKELTVSAVLLPQFKDAGEHARTATPKMQLSTSVLDLGSFGEKNKLKGSIFIQNIGNTTLDIERLQMYTVGLQVSINKTKIAPGKIAKLKVTAFENLLKKARSKPRILMITNDPDQPKVIIHIKAQ